MSKSKAALWASLITAMVIFVGMNLLFVKPAHAVAPSNAPDVVVNKGVGGVPGIEHIRVRAQYKVWTRDLRLSTGAGEHIQVTITTEYYYWPGRKPPFVATGHRVTPYGVDLCYAFHAGVSPGLLWQGISADSEWFDDKNGILVQDLRTGDKGRGGCVHETVPLEHRVWLHSGTRNGICHNPFWLAEGWANWRGIGDQSFHWHSPRIDDSKCLWPKKDQIITTKSGKVWRTILKTW